MARARNIKPSIMDNEELAALPALARLLFVYLWMLADRRGRLEDRPRRIAAQALPYDADADIDAMLFDLAEAGFILRYVEGNIACIQVLAFEKHQTPHVREQDSNLPGYVEGTSKVVPRHRQGSAKASPRSPDSLIPDSLIPDTSASPPRSCDVMTLPDAINPAAWAQWVEYRRSRRKPISATAARLQWQQLAALDQAQQAACIEQSIRNDWQGLFPEKLNGGSNVASSATLRSRSIADDLTDRSWAAN